MPKESKILIEFQLEALEAQVYIRNKLLNRPNIKGFKLLPNKAFNRIKLIVSYLKVQGYRAIIYIDIRVQPQQVRSNKLINRGKDTIFIRYYNNIVKVQKFQELDIKAIKQYTNIIFFKDKLGRELDLNIKVKNLSSLALERRLVSRLRTISQPTL